jgi:hypothetical protein
MLGRHSAKNMSFAPGHLSSHGVNLDKIGVEAVVRQHPLTEEMVKLLRMPPMTFQNFAAEWAAFAGPVKDKTKFTFSKGLHESKHGFVVLQVKWERGELDVGFMLLPLQDTSVELEEDEELPEEDDLVTVWASTLDEKYMVADEVKWLEEIWNPFTPVEQIIKTEKKIQPNDPCSCGSGRKFKKCCGRFGMQKD